MTIRNHPMIGALVLGALFAASPIAAQNDGHMDGVWASAELSGAFNTVDDSDDPVVSELKLKGKTEKGSCFLRFSWDGVDSWEYDVVSVCRDDNDEWESMYTESIQETAEGHLVDDYGYTTYLLPGDEHDDDTDFDSDGFHLWIPKVKNGEVKSLKFIGNKGSSVGIWYDEGGPVEGFGIGKLKIKLVPEEDVPEEALALFVK